MRKRVLSAAETHIGFDRGVDQIVAAIRPSLGPTPRAVGVERPDRKLAPELLDSGADIARRIVALPHEWDDPGAMYLRGFLWRMGNTVGDGTATAAVLFRAILAGGRRAIAAGIPAQPLRSQLDEIANVVCAHLSTMAYSTTDRHSLTQAAVGVCHDVEIAELLGDVFDVAGADGEVVVIPSKRRESWREFVEGAYWDGGAHSLALMQDAVRQRSDLIEPAIAISNLAIDDPLTLVPVIRAALEANAKGLVVIAESVSDRAISLMVANSRPAFPIVAVKVPGFGEEGRRHALIDLAVMTGGRALLKEAGDAIDSITAPNLGQVRRAWMTRQHFGIISGAGDARAVRSWIRDLKSQRARATRSEERLNTTQRLGKFRGVSATIWVGAGSEPAAKRRIDATNRSILVLREIVRHGTVPGGGSALMACRQVLAERRAAAEDKVERAALDIVSQALEMPFRTILQNGGYEAAPIVAELERRAPEYGFDAIAGRIVDLREAGIVTAVGVLIAVTAGAITSAALALTIDATVLTRKTTISTDPE